MSPMMAMALIALYRLQLRENEPAGQWADAVAIEIDCTIRGPVSKDRVLRVLYRLKERGLVVRGDPKKGWGSLWLPSVRGNKLVGALMAMGLPEVRE